MPVSVRASGAPFQSTHTLMGSPLRWSTFQYFSLSLKKNKNKTIQSNLTFVVSPGAIEQMADTPSESSASDPNVMGKAKAILCANC